MVRGTTPWVPGYLRPKSHFAPSLVASKVATEQSSKETNLTSTCTSPPSPLQTLHRSTLTLISFSHLAPTQTSHFLPLNSRKQCRGRSLFMWMSRIWRQIGGMKSQLEQVSIMTGKQCLCQSNQRTAYSQRRAHKQRSWMTRWRSKFLTRHRSSWKAVAGLRSPLLILSTCHHLSRRRLAQVSFPEPCNMAAWILTFWKRAGTSPDAQTHVGGNQHFDIATVLAMHRGINDKAFSQLAEGTEILHVQTLSHVHTAFPLSAPFRSGLLLSAFNVCSPHRFQRTRRHIPRSGWNAQFALMRWRRAR